MDRMINIQVNVAMFVEINVCFLLISSDCSPWAYINVYNMVPIIGISVASLRLFSGYITKKQSGSRSMPPRIHVPSTVLPRLYYLFPNFAS